LITIKAIKAIKADQGVRVIDFRLFRLFADQGVRVIDFRLFAD